MPWLEADAHTEAVERARDLVLRRLDRCAAPRAALADLLARKEVDARVAEEVLDRLEAAGVVDDAAYAATLARTRLAEKGVARRAVAEELRRKGLREEHVQEALAQINEEDEEAAALRLALKRARASTRLAPETARRRALAHLARKGHSPSVAQDAWRAAVEQVAAEQ